MMNDSTRRQMTILLLGSGAREHAIAWKLAQSPLLGRLVCAPGNPGIARLAELRSADIESPEDVVALARELAADLVVVGPEAPLAAGVSDALRDAGFVTFGPSKAAARLEWDKAFAKDFMHRHMIPTAASRTFTSEQLDEARASISASSMPIVIKASGLAAGKGVVIAATVDEALEATEGMLSGSSFGTAGSSVVIEEFMTGEEASILVITDGAGYRMLAPSQDHKRVGDGDTGPNTGGMGAYAPAPIVTPALLDRIAGEIIEPTLAGMREEGTPYSGCLYVGVMIDQDRPRVVEFNSRFGDPETQVVLPLIDADFIELLMAASTGKLGELGEIRSRGAAVCVVLASAGYPGSYRKGDEITGIDRAESLGGTVVFHAGTTLDGDRLVTSGGRVLGVTAITDGDRGLEDALELAYRAVGMVSFAGAFHRNDIGARRSGMV
ncbi:MAG: phosphoribosylamine--glycine ligase [Chlorobi bacterium]|nr:phosphoribosylamine--glycine ligase [Chlorobiota bacterium]